MWLVATVTPLDGQAGGLLCFWRFCWWFLLTMQQRSRALEAVTGCLCCVVAAVEQQNRRNREVSTREPRSCVPPIYSPCAPSINGRLYLARWWLVQIRKCVFVCVCTFSTGGWHNHVQQRVSVARQPHLKTLTNQNKVQQQVLSWFHLQLILCHEVWTQMIECLVKIMVFNVSWVREEI